MQIKLHELKCRLKLAIKIILGDDIIIYEENTKNIKMIINGYLDIYSNGLNLDYVIDKYISENNGDMKYLR